MIVYKAEPQYIDVLWPYVYPLLSKAIKRTIGEINLEDIKKIKSLNNSNIEGVIVGKSIYDGDIKINELAKQI